MEQPLILNYPATGLPKSTVSTFILFGELLFLLSTPMNSGNYWPNARWATADPLKTCIAKLPGDCSQWPYAA